MNQPFALFCTAHNRVECPKCFGAVPETMTIIMTGADRQVVEAVSLPTAPVAKEAPAEETQALLSDWCAACGLARVYCRH